MIVFSAIVPHSPLLCPTTEYVKKCKKTLKSLMVVEQNLYAAKPETIIFISPSHNDSPSFLINMYPSYSINMSQLGDYSQYNTFYSDIPAISTINSFYHNTDFNIKIISNTLLDYGISIPLYFLSTHLQEIKIVPIYTCAQDANIHYEFGKKLLSTIYHLNKRVAIIVSVDLTKFDPKIPVTNHAFEFDKKIIEQIKNKDLSAICALPQDMLTRSHSCAPNPLAVLAGLLIELNYHPEIISHEIILNSGLLVAQFNMV